MAAMTTPYTKNDRTYDQFVQAANDAGKMSEFSDYDLALAKKNPEAGFSILTNKINYGKATTPEAKALYNAQANDIRQTYGEYKADETGSGYTSTRVSPGLYSSGYEGTMQSILGQIQDRMNQPNESKYSQDVTDLYNKLKNYNLGDYYQSDAYKTLANEYTQKGQQAMQDTMGQMSARTGGIASSYAGSAASQTYNDYMGQLASAAQEGYQNERSNLNSLFSRAKSLDSAEKSANSDYISNLINLYGMYQNADQTGYSRNMDELEYQQGMSDTEKADERYADETNYSRQQTEEQNEREDKQAMQSILVNLMLSGGGYTPTQEMLDKAGLGGLDRNALATMVGKLYNLNWLQAI